MELLLRIGNRCMLTNDRYDRSIFQHLSTVVSLLSFRGIGVTMQFALSVILGRMLGADGLGIYYLYVTWMVVLSSVFGLGLPFYTLRNASYLEGTNQHDKANQFVMNSLKIGILAGFVMAIPIYLFAPEISLIFLKDIELSYIVRMISVAGVIFLCLRIISEALQARGKPKLGISGETTILPGCVLAVTGIILLYGLSINDFNLINSHLIILLAVSAIMFCIWRWSSKPVYIAKEVRDHGKSIVPAEMLTFWGNSLLSVVFINMPILLLTYFETPEEVGHFGVAFRLMGLATTILIAMASIFGPRFARHYARNDIKELTHDFHMSQIFSFLVYLPFAIAFFLFATPTLSVFGPQFGDSKNLLWILAGGQLFNAMTGLVGYLLNMIKKEKIEFMSLLVATLLMFFLSGFLGMKYGSIGIAIGYAVTLAIKNIFSLVLAYIYLKRLRKEFIGGLP